MKISIINKLNEIQDKFKNIFQTQKSQTNNTKIIIFTLNMKEIRAPKRHPILSQKSPKQSEIKQKRELHTQCIHTNRLTKQNKSEYHKIFRTIIQTEQGVHDYAGVIFSENIMHIFISEIILPNSATHQIGYPNCLTTMTHHPELPDNDDVSNCS